MKIHVETIPHSEQRYPTVGDYWSADGVQHIRVSHMVDWRYEVLVAMHELVEMALTRHRGISEPRITEFDLEFERSREQGRGFSEPGDHPDAPYRKEHFFATNIERLFAAELDVDWFVYDEYVESLGVKK
jgi:hypothetical protein